ncbi:hypothetical protein AB6A40_006626 [Gnathostoma spinigerum]|uniref:DUF5641 domain-containing protein n=1 Tax=Gnathostoma spinigerum TaxID=75299 RepID=A0ABD6EL36_9BILA
MDNENWEILRPIDFLRPKANIVAVEPADDEDTSFALNSTQKILNRWESSLRYLDRLWQVWSKEYLLSLRERYQREHQQACSRTVRSPRVNEIVLIKHDELPRAEWPLARIEEIKRSADGKVRSASVRTSNGHVLDRPLNLLLPLEITAEEKVEDKVGDPNLDEEADESEEEERNGKVHRRSSGFVKGMHYKGVTTAVPANKDNVVVAPVSR